MEYGAELLERPPLEEAELQDTQAAACAGKKPHVRVTVYPGFNSSRFIGNIDCELFY